MSYEERAKALDLAQQAYWSASEAYKADPSQENLKKLNNAIDAKRAAFSSHIELKKV